MASNRQIPGENTAPVTTPARDDKWDEARYEASLKHLHELHLRKLRSTVPRMIEPAAESQSHETPEELFASLQQSVTKGMGDVKEFKAAMNDETTVRILERARQGRLKNPLGIKPWRPRDDPNWTKMDLD
ncbi:hypothetical protein MAPG_08126 [Magnaporthiopsis poae ATCC 64411]|uniref:Uncharacterized protein n=1 Tax=Magnaporthiopsis poae (strain ATCC 64411 / 73-15) TaxID=644358 RepID=A0A0C4E6I8_MAGP6|nr:hypothetical protein MAPG_08126 [Magnaporthiopsis poae ATCC 64411]